MTVCCKLCHQKLCSEKYFEKISEIPRIGEKTNLRHQKLGDSIAEVEAYDDLDWTD